MARPMPVALPEREGSDLTPNGASMRLDFADELPCNASAAATKIASSPTIAFPRL